MMFDSILQRFSTQSPLADAAGSLSGPRRRWRRRSVRGLGGAAVTDHDRDPLCGRYLTLIIEGYLAGTLAVCQLGEKLVGQAFEATLLRL